MALPEVYIPLGLKAAFTDFIGPALAGQGPYGFSPGLIIAGFVVASLASMIVFRLIRR